MFDLNGKKALITGASGGIGGEIAKTLNEAGAEVAISGTRLESLEALSDTLGGNTQIFQCNLSDPLAIEDLLKDATEKMGGIDILINNAGIMGPDSSAQTALNMDFDGWAETFAVNTMGPVRVLQALLPNLKKSSNARVVNITSQMGAISLDMPLAFAYCSSKAALNKFTKLAAGSLAEEGIHVCLIHPGWVKTDMGGKGAEITPAQSAAGIAETIENLNQETTGSFWKWDGQPHEW